jgi:hypothetical protein
MPDQDLKHVYWHVSGFTVEECTAIGYRYASEDAIRDDQVESWLLYFTKVTEETTKTSSATAWNGLFNGVWRSASGRIYVTGADGEVVVGEITTRSGKRAFDRLVEQELDCALTGIWGLDDQHVWAYGGAPDRPGKIRFFDGKTWNKLPDAPAWILHMHGCAPDCVYGVGQKTLFRWDGKDWHETGLRAAVSLASVWVASPDEIYVTDVGGVLFEGSADGFIERARWEGPLDGVAKWKGELWLGGEEAGLLKLDGKSNKIEAFKPKVFTRAIEARKHMLIAAENRIVISQDGQEFYSVGKNALLEIAQNTPFMG